MALVTGIVAVAALGMGLAPAPANAQEEAALRAAEQLGASLYQVDRALRAAEKEGERSRAFRRDERVQGRVVELQPDAIRITYLGAEDGSLQGLYRVAVDRAGKVLAALERIEPEPLNGRIQIQHAISHKAQGVERVECSNEVETVVIPSADGWNAYVLPRAAFPDVYLLGGSYRVALSSSGEVVTQVQALASECVILQNKSGTGALLFAEDRGSVPNELHVYISALAGKPLYVTTTPNGRTWLIQEGRIQSVQAIPSSAG